jgi:hypothetical protein
VVLSPNIGGLPSQRKADGGPDTDTCTTCTPKQLNLHYTAFKQYIADPALGTVGVQYQQVDIIPDDTSILCALHLPPLQQGGWATAMTSCLSR